MFFLIHTRTVWNQVLMFTDPTSGWFWQLPSTLYGSTQLYNYITENQPRLVPPQARAIPHYKVYMFFVIHTRTVWNQVLMFTGPTSGWFWSLPCTFYDPTQYAKEITDLATTRTTPSKSQTVLQSLYLLSNTY